jgi:hypothetical protein
MFLWVNQLLTGHPAYALSISGTSAGGWLQLLPCPAMVLISPRAGIPAMLIMLPAVAACMFCHLTRQVLLKRYGAGRASFQRENGFPGTDSASAGVTV